MGSTVSPVAKRPGFFRTLWRVVRQVFHETTGAVFCILALIWANASLRYWRDGAPRWEWRTGVAVALVMVFFGVASFRAARRVR